MPKGPSGQKRKADVIGNAVLVMKIATGQEPETSLKSPGRAVGGKAGGPARAKKLPASKRVKIAKAAAQARWSAKD